MKKAIVCFVIFLGCTFQVQAQYLSDLSGPVLKIDEKISTETELPVKISDFRYQSNSAEGSGLINTMQTKPGIAMLSSALIPGSGQAANNKWIRAGVYFAAEVAGIVYHLNLQHKAERRERQYEQFVHENWSVLAYAEWIVNYSQINELDNGWEELRDHIAGKTPDYTNTTNDWAKVNQALLHRIESQTPFVFEGDDATAIQNRNSFSHELPKYGSQQYYELVSKYYQFQPGWQDWYTQITTNPQAQNVPSYQYMWNGDDQPFTLFYTGRDLAEEFNDNYRVAGNILKLLLVNHVVSAFDAYFTVKLKNSRLEADANLLSMEQVSLKWHF